ncbi:polysaccharide biosynthesis/export family protein [Pedosphaera parvula]|uniref:Polysaccharide export protein n=1 Tax=Pedosphaera parvula (strain Ellin514) TaxID=320771 RepID=B9X9K8_PEDPL|nr:polysaccharide biosynthesis/export family protein [Pedosphaera parvula]EEF63252.1 polysaccharide export protein [Pedosphaera parvula Ellin514]
MKSHLSYLWIGLTLALFATGCQHPGPRFNPYELKSAQTLQLETITNAIDSNLLKPPTEPFRLGPGDRVEIEIMDDTTSRTLSVVGPDGKIYFSLLPGLDVWGKTLPETKDLLEKQLAQYYRNQPRVALTLRGVESRRFWMLGRVQTPGVYFMTNSPTLLEGISLAGGTVSYAAQKDLSVANTIDETADLKRSFLIRQGHMLPVDFERLVTKGDLTQNIYLQPDDFIYFPAANARTVYVIGAVGQARAVPYAEGMTMSAAIANSYGTIKDAYLYKVAVIRGSLSQPKVALVNYYDVMAGKTPDVTLEPHDIVYVPFAPYRLIRRFANAALDTFVSSVAINEGIRAVNNNGAALPAGVFIPVGSRITVTPSSSSPAVFTQ